MSIQSWSNVYDAGPRSDQTRQTHCAGWDESNSNPQIAQSQRLAQRLAQESQLAHRRSTFALTL